MTQPVSTHRIFVPRDPTRYAVHIHELGCTCPDCDDTPRFTVNAAARYGLAGIAFGAAIACAIDPHGAFGALRTVLGL